MYFEIGNLKEFAVYAVMIWNCCEVFWSNFFHFALVEKKDLGTGESTRAWCPYGPLVPSSGALSGARIPPFY
jgi:hypothetical protein